MLASTSKTCYGCLLAVRQSARAGFSTSIVQHRKRPPRDAFADPQEQEDIRGDAARLHRVLDFSSEARGTSSVATSILNPGQPAEKPQWRLHREALREKFPEGWNPPRKVSRGEMNTIRRLHNLDSVQFGTPELADKFKISSEAVRRILKSKYRNEDELEEERVGDALLREADLGEYNRHKSQDSTYVPRTRSEPVQFAQRRTAAARPLRKGYDPEVRAAQYKWASPSQQEVGSD